MSVSTLEVVDLDVDLAAEVTCEDDLADGTECPRVAAWLLIGTCAVRDHRALVCVAHRGLWLQRIAAGWRVTCPHRTDVTVRWVAL